MYKYLKKKIKSSKSFSLFIIKWFTIISIISFISGSCSALLLVSLEKVTAYREHHLNIIFVLPLAGLLIGCLYYYFGKDIEGGNHLIIQNIRNYKKKIPWIISPFIYISTLVTHLFGGSAGREGTGLQMAAAFSDAICKYFKLTTIERKTLLIISVAGGFASVFGTPFTGTIFALEFFTIGIISYQFIVPALITALFSNLITQWWQVKHAIYIIPYIPEISFYSIFNSFIAGAIFGLIAFIFIKGMDSTSKGLKNIIKYAPLRPLIGGVLIILLVMALKNFDYLGLGLELLDKSFNQNISTYVFILKMLFTIITLSSGFKGGEVTPLFVIGATLGNFLAWFIPLPFPLLSGMGFIAVFAGATNTPLACIIMGIELFGGQGVVYFAIACITAYLFSGRSSIYSKHMIEENKQMNYTKRVEKRIEEIL